MKFKIGDVILRTRRKQTRTIIRYENDGYILSDKYNTFGEVWWNKYQVDEYFKLVEK